MHQNSTGQRIDTDNAPWLTIGETSFQSRLLIGIEQYSSARLIKQVLEAAQAQVFITTFDLEHAWSSIPLTELESIIDIQRYIWIGTTSFATTAEDAISTARMLKSSFNIHILKLDVRDHNNAPDNKSTIRVAKQLIHEGFFIIPFIFPNVKDALELEQLGCSALRLMASPVGSGKGIVNSEKIQQVLLKTSLPTIIEAGLRSPSDVALAMELGADAVLVNAAIVQAQNPVLMATAMKKAVDAGRQAYLAGLMEKQRESVPY